ncbi:MAG: DUF1629 domain-containing protein [Pseudomonadota bacterium]
MAYTLLSTGPPLESNIPLYWEALGGSLDSFQIDDLTQDAGLKVIQGLRQTGRRMSAQNPPKAMRRVGPSLKVFALGDYTFWSDIHIVSPRLHALIERMEPGAHQFWPVDVHVAGYRNEEDYFEGSGGGDDPALRRELFDRRYLMNVCNRLDGIDLEASQPITERGFLSYRGKDRRIVLDRRRIAGRHLWYEMRLNPRMLIVSEAFADALRAEEMTGFGLTAIEEH